MNGTTGSWILMGVTLIALSAAFYLLAGTFGWEVHAILFAVTVPIVLVGEFMMVTGKGSNLISGFNTSPARIRDAYDRQALARFVGAVVTVSSLATLASVECLILSDDARIGTALLIVSVASVVAAVAYMNTGGRFLKDPDRPVPRPTPEEIRKRRRIVLPASCAAILTAGVVIAAMFAYGSVSADIREDRVEVKAPMVDETVMFTDITSVSLRHDIDLGSRANGWGSPRIKSGSFRNGDFGTYTLASYSDVHTYIVIERTDGKYLVFNLETADRTSEAYTLLAAVT